MSQPEPETLEVSPRDSPSRRPGTFAALRLRDFRVMWIGTVTSYVGFFMSTIVMSVVAFELTGTNRAVGAVVFAQGLAMAALGPLGGAFADRWPKRRTLAVTQTASAVVFAVLAALLATDSLHIFSLAAGTFLLGAAIAFLGPARQAMAVDLVPEATRGNAVALNQVALTGSQVAGPAIAGLLLASRFGSAGAYFVMTVLYTIAAISLIFLPASSGRPGASETHVLSDLVDGLRYTWGHPRLRILVLFFVSVIVMGFPYVTVLPGLVEHGFHVDADAISTLYFVSAVGGLASSLFVARLADSRFALPVFVCMALTFGLAIAGLATAPSFSAAVGVMVFVGIGIGGFQSLNGAVIVRATEPAYLGRVFSLTMLAYAGFGLMGLPIGLLADGLGEPATLLVMGGSVCAIVAGAAALLARTRDANP